MKRTLSLLMIVIAPVMYGARRRAAVVVPFPPCVIVQGTPAVTFTRDEGRTLAPVAMPLTGTGYTYGLAALDVPHTFLSFHKDTLSISTDDGCHWSAIGNYVADFPPTITAAKGGRAYIWSDNRQFLLRYDSTGVVTLKPPGSIVGLGVDKNDGMHVRIGTDDGAVVESLDGGATWRGVGFPPAFQTIFYRIVFDPNDLNHVVSGTSVNGAYVSRDGGVSYTRATGFQSQSVNVFNVVISPADGNVVWVMAIDLTSGESPKRIYMSRDGGLTYVAVVEQSADVTIVNQPVMAAHPTNRDVMYFVFGTFFQGFGTDIYRYDASTRTLTTTHNDYSDVNAIAFHPDRPDIMYFGLEVEHVQ